MNEVTRLDLENVRMRNEIYEVVEYIEDHGFVLSGEEARILRDELLRIADGT